LIILEYWHDTHIGVSHFANALSIAPYNIK